MKYIIPLLFCGVAIISASCNMINDKKEEKLAAEDFTTVEVDKRYKIRLPNYMTESKNLNDEASLQYQNIFKETYTIVIDESKQEFIDAFMDAEVYDTTLSVAKNYQYVQLSSIEERITVNSKSEPVKLNIGTHEAYQIEVDGNVEGAPQEISYLFTFVEGKEELFMIMSWTAKSRKEKYFNTFKEVAQSFRTRKVQ